MIKQMTFYNTDLDSRPPPDLVPLQSKVCLHTWQLLGDNEIDLTSQRYLAASQEPRLTQTPSSVQFSQLDQEE